MFISGIGWRVADSLPAHDMTCMMPVRPASVKEYLESNHGGHLASRIY